VIKVIKENQLLLRYSKEYQVKRASVALLDQEESQAEMVKKVTKVN
jgi:hypothetical protein